MLLSEIKSEFARLLRAQWRAVNTGTEGADYPELQISTTAGEMLGGPPAVCLYLMEASYATTLDPLGGWEYLFGITIFLHVEGGADIDTYLDPAANSLLRCVLAVQPTAGWRIDSEDEAPLDIADCFFVAGGGEVECVIHTIFARAEISGADHTYPDTDPP